MAALLEKEINPQLRRRDVSNTFTVTRAEETPFVSMVKKGPRPKATLYEWLIKVRHTPTDNAVADGVDVADGDVVNNEANKKPMQGRVQKGRVAFGVSDMAEELGEEYGVAGGLLADNRADALVLAKENMEVTCIKTGDSQAHIDNSNPMKLRGLCSFIRTANPPDPDLPIPSIGLVPAGNILSGAADFSIQTQGADALEPGQSTAVTLRFLPSAVGARSGYLRITSNVPGARGNVLLALAGNGVALPTATTTSATLVTNSAARLRGSVKSNHDTSSVFAEYKRTTDSAWTRTPAITVSGFAATAVQFDVSGLFGPSVYQYRIGITNPLTGASAPVWGATVNFTTLPP